MIPCLMELKPTPKYVTKTPALKQLLKWKIDKIKAFFHRKVNAITPGQSAVFYEGDDLVGGGIIESATA